jgi:hypothetical protein
MAAKGRREHARPGSLQKLATRFVWDRLIVVFHRF